jgi:hypothetical protein
MSDSRKRRLVVGISDTAKFISRLIVVMMILSAGISRADDELRIEPDQLKTKLGQSSVFILDARVVPDWRKSDLKIAGAVREDPMEIGSWTHRYPKNRTLVLYCD